MQPQQSPAESGYPWKREAKLLVPAWNRWFDTGTREVVAYVKGPDAGITPETGICLLLHGVGGRQNDISWKRLRRDIANRWNLICIGVNFFGTAIQERDDDFVFRQFERVLHSFKYRSVKALQNPDGTHLIRLNDPHFFYFENPYSMEQAALPFADEYWDWGLVQALDVLAACREVHRHARASGVELDICRVCALSRSGGAQVAFTLAKLAPNLLSGYFDAGGAIFAQENLSRLQVLLEDPFGHVSEHDQNRLGITFDQPPVTLQLRRRWPIGGFSQAGAGEPQWADHVAIRDTLNPAHMAHAPMQRYKVMQGADDLFYPIAIKERACQLLTNAGVECQLIAVDQSMVDGTLITNTGHTFSDDFNTLVMNEFESIATCRRETSAKSSELVAPSLRELASPTGIWRMEHGDAPIFQFEPGTGGHA